MNGTFNTALIASNGSQVIRLNAMTMTGDAVITLKYQIVRNSYLDTGGRGTEWMLGGEGNKDDTSIIQ